MGHGTIIDTMDVIRKGRYLKHLENYHIYKISRNNLHMNDTLKNTILHSKEYINFTTGSSTYTA
jgi:hypothetical protein